MTEEPHASSGRRYPRIEDHALIGDGRAVALIDRQATIDWLALPEDPEVAVCSSLLDAEAGGRCTVTPRSAYRVERRYLDDSAALRTTFRTDSGVAHVDDVFNLHNGSVLPWVELARRVTLEEGTVELDWELRVTGRLGGELGAFRTDHGKVRSRVDGVVVGLQAHGSTTCEAQDRCARGTVSLGADRPRAMLALLVVVDEPLVHPDWNELERRAERTIDHWREWTGGLALPSRWPDAVRSSARTLKLLIQEGTGAPLAAATTSLPERIGGPRNFDYRFCWVRDASFTVDALLRVGLVEEAHSALLALLDMARRTEPDLAPMYTVRGEVPSGSTEIAMDGYMGSKPVRSGNSACDQLQLGTWGHLFDAMWRYVLHENELDLGTRSLLRSLGDRLCDRWREPDAGIWELDDRQHYTISKVGAWAALDRALRLADAGQLDGDLERWRDARAEIRRFIEERCWSSERHTFTMHPDTGDIDASCLLTGMLEFASEEQLSGTIDAVRHELADGPWVWRYSGVRERESAFIACSFWLADAQARTGATDDAAAQLEAVLEAANDVGLLSEEHDPTTGAALGNFPQGLSHLSLINAAGVLGDLLGE